MSTMVDAIFDGEVLRPQIHLDLKPNAHYWITIEETAPETRDLGTARSPYTPRANSAEAPLGSDREADMLSSAAWTLYDEKLKAILEPAHNGQVVAIHPESGDYEVGRNSPQAWKALEKRQPEGLIAVLDIGVAPELYRHFLSRQPIQFP